MTETLHWSVEGAFITDLVRQWFWYEHRPYEKCEELLLSCLCTDAIDEQEKKDIAQKIIEGRYKLVGVNEFTLEEDGENVRPISEMLNQQRDLLNLNRIKEDMEHHALKYVDPYSTVKSIRSAREHYTLYSTEDCKRYFWYRIFEDDRDVWDEDPDFDDPVTQSGLWLFDEPELILKIADPEAPIRCVYEDDFWDKMYDLVKDRSGHEWIHRNERYLAAKRAEEKPGTVSDESEKPTYTSTKEAEENIAYITERLAKMEENDSRYHHMEHCLSEIEESELKYTSDIVNYYLLPDDFLTWEGLISPTGDFYSCDFGGHNQKAYHLLACRPELFSDEIIEEFDAHINFANALDLIVKAGWCAIRWLPTHGRYVTSGTRVTKKQVDTMYDDCYRHGINMDLTDLL